jgi:hypothetical protein
MDNIHKVSVPDNVVEEVKRRLAEISQLLKIYMIALTPEERRRMAKMGDKTHSFVSKAYDLAKENPNLCPKYLDIDELGIDVKDAVNLVALKVAVNQIYESIADTEMIAGSEAYKGALEFYQEVKRAAKNDVYGAKAVYEVLKTRFPRGKRSKEDENEPDSDNK